MWTKKDLEETIKNKFGAYDFIVVSNREPYVHEHSGKKVRCVKSIGGLTAAMDPIMQASKGVWVAYGSGDADKDVVDKDNKIKVPPEDPKYSLKRIWMTKEEENGFYYGYANQVLWPLSHIAYRQPVFDASHWEYYQEVNQRFAEAVLEEKRDNKLFVWLQDYHLSLCAKIIKEKSPDAIVSLFWHIPWPNPEVFRICPQKKKLLEGLLANDLLGFHLRYHCLNFLDTVRQEMEAKVNREESSVTYRNHKTLVRPFPISVDAEGISQMANNKEVKKRMKIIPEEIGPPYEILCLSIDRVDYTKGILEKIKAVDRFLEKYPEYQGRFVFLELGALSRLHIKTYKQLIDDIESLAEEVNWKYRSGYWYPIVIINRRLDYTTHLAYYRTCDLFLVGSLHDGMNLVAKEYNMANVDLKGMLVLSQFTGAARELKDAILINPFDIEGVADAIFSVCKMSEKERKRRMRKMQKVILENNIYKWAGKFILQLSEL